jgi:hypothetical protein
MMTVSSQLSSTHSLSMIKRFYMEVAKRMWIQVISQQQTGQAQTSTV